MNRTVRLTAVCALLALVVFQFNNCAQAPEAIEYPTSFSSVSCANESCITPTVDNLKITANAPGNQYIVGPALAEFNIGGDCNEGAFPYNTIIWELRLDGIAKRHSGMSGMVSGGGPAHSSCVNGRFLLYINLYAIAEDNVNRVGLRKENGQYAPYDLYIEIYGQNTPGGAPQRGSVTQARYRLPFIPAPNN